MNRRQLNNQLGDLNLLCRVEGPRSGQLTTKLAFQPEANAI